MSIKEKFEAIKKDSETKKTTEEISKGKESLREVLDQKNVLTNRINDLKSLVFQIKGAYRSSRDSLENFKKTSGNIKELYSEYEDYLKEKGIDSVEDILHSDDFQDEAEVKEYYEAGAAQVDETGKRGKLGENVKEVAKAKAAVKKALPDIELDFRGKKKEGEEVSPRKTSILKIENYISELETELEEINKKESEQREEILPKIKEIIGLGVDKIFSNESLHLEPQMANKKIIDDKVLELGGDELWPQIKETTKKEIQKTVNEKQLNLRLSNEDIESSLEAEKFLYDLDKIKEEHGKILELKKEEEDLKRMRNEIKRDYFLQSSAELLIKGDKLYPNHLMERANYFEEKNVEAKKVCEDIINEYLSAYKTAKKKVPSGFVIGKKNKEAIEGMTAILDEAIEKMEEMKVPDNFYCDKPYEFTNKLLAIPPRFDIKSTKNWALEMRKELIDLDVSLTDKLNNLRNKEGGALKELNNDLYNATSNRPTTEINGFSVPYQDVKKLYSYNQFKNTEEVDEIFKKVNNLKLSHEGLVKLFAKERENLSNKINDYPESEKILARLKELEDKFDNNYKNNTIIIQRKIAAEKGNMVRDHNKKEDYEVRRELFNN